MAQFSEHTQWQAQLYDQNPPLNPYDTILRVVGFDLVTRPKDLKTKQYLEKFINKKETKILDLGCASGLLLQRISKTFNINGTGVDVSQVLINKAIQLDLQNNYIIADASRLPFPDNSFDLVTSFDNLEHIKEYQQVITEIVRVLKPGGKLLLNTINKHNRFTFDWLLEKLGSDYHLKRAGHIKELFFDPCEIQNLFKNAGLQNTQIHLTDATGILIADTVLYLFLILSEKIGSFFGIYNSIGYMALKVTTLISKLLLPILEKTDTLITHFGYSNAFFVTGEKV